MLDVGLNESAATLPLWQDMNVFSIRRQKVHGLDSVVTPDRFGRDVAVA